VPRINRSALVLHSAQAMFGLVDDIKSYPEFLPWCASSKELARDEQGVCAQVELRKGRVHKSFTTQNSNNPGVSITMQLIEGPFKKLEGVWSFQALDEGSSKVSLDLQYEFSNVLLRMTVGPVFQQIADKLVDAFCQRANDIYGQNSND